MLFRPLVFKFRAKEKRPPHRNTLPEKRRIFEAYWISIPHYMIIVCDIRHSRRGYFGLGYNIKQVMPAADETVRVIGQQWAWSFQEAGPGWRDGHRRRHSLGGRTARPK